MYSRFMEVTHPDIAGFHEGFADIVALLQHFSYPEIVCNQIRKVRGNLDTENLLAKLAVEFGQSTGEYKSLRDAIGRTNEKGKWQLQIPSTTDYDNNLECHDRGALLVAAVFDAFHAIYKNRTADLVRLATGGTGIIADGEIHPDLVKRLADEASKVASHVLNMCVRALDYCPPVDLNYGDYLRALITADKELVANDDHHYRIAFINAFRKRGIFPEGVPNLSVDTLCYNILESEPDKKGFTAHVAGFLRGFKEKLAYKTDRKEIFDETVSFIRGDKTNMTGFYEYLFTRFGKAKDSIIFENITGLVFSDNYRALGIGTSQAFKKGPSVEIHSLRLHNKIGPDGNILNQIILTLCQRCKVAVIKKDDATVSFEPYRNTKAHQQGESFIFRGGCTLIFDLNNLSLKHAIRKPIFDPFKAQPGKRRKLELNQARVKMQYDCMLGELTEKIGVAGPNDNSTELFAALHESKNLEL
jgi:hypothetical protein